MTNFSPFNGTSIETKVCLKILFSGLTFLPNWLNWHLEIGYVLDFNFLTLYFVGVFWRQPFQNCSWAFQAILAVHEVQTWVIENKLFCLSCIHILNVTLLNYSKLWEEAMPLPHHLRIEWYSSDIQGRTYGAFLLLGTRSPYTRGETRVDQINSSFLDIHYGGDVIPTV